MNWLLTPEHPSNLPLLMPFPNQALNALGALKGSQVFTLEVFDKLKRKHAIAITKNRLHIHARLNTGTPATFARNDDVVSVNVIFR